MVVVMVAFCVSDADLFMDDEPRMVHVLVVLSIRFIIIV